MSENFEKTSFLFGSNSIFIEELYQKYLEDPKSIDISWQEFFHSHQDIIPFKTTSKIIIKEQAGEIEEKKVASTLSENSLRARFMIDSYRKRGHYLANLDPLGLEVVKTREELNLNIEDFGFTADQMNEVLDITEQYGIKVIFQSGTGKETDFSKARKLGANHCLSIPYGYKDLLLLLQQSQTHSSIESFA